MSTTMNIKDTDWIRQSFILPRNAVSNMGAKRMVNSDAALKFTDTTLGGAFAINPLPQFNEFTDIPVENKWATGTAMGGYYSEAYDDNQRYIHMRFGVPEFNSLTSFFGNFYNAEASYMARTGQASTDLFFKMGKAAGFLLALPLQPFILLGAGIRWMLHMPSTKYYYLKPAMALYWQATSTIANTIMVNMGFVQPIYGDNYNTVTDQSNKLTSTDLKRWAKAFPDLFTEDGNIDIFSVATRSQRMADRNRERLVQILEEATSSDDLQKRLTNYANEKFDSGKQPRLTEYLESYLNSSAGKKTQETDAEVKPRSWLEKAGDAALGEMHDGSQWVTWRVSGAGTVSESFSNSTGNSEIADTINSMSSSKRQTDFSWADGLGIDYLDAIADKVKNVASGVADSLHISGLAVLKGKAFVDIPKVWESSEFQFPRIDYKIELRSWAGDPVSRIMSLIIPLSMALPMVMPISTGPASYGHPFLVELYDKGRCQTRLGIVESMTIERGVGNLGWTVDGHPLGIDISFSIADLSSVMHMPITAGMSLDLKQVLFPEESMFNDYLAVLGGLSLQDQVYNTNRMRLNLTRWVTNARTWKSPARWANMAFSSIPGRIISAFANNTSRGI